MSIPAKLVAQDVLEAVRKGEKPHLGKILRKRGYAQTTSTVPTQVTNTKAYQEEIAPIVLAMIKERDAIMERLPKVRNFAKYRDLTDGVDKMTKNIQLLSGGKTSNDSYVVTWQK